MTENAILLLATLGYAAAATTYVAHFATRRAGSGRAASALLYATLATHTVWLVLVHVRLGHLPIATAQDGLSFVAWGMALAYVLIELRFGQRAFGGFVTPVALLFQLVSAAFRLGAPPAGPLPEILRSVWFEIHAGTALFSYCAFSIAFAAGLMHVILYHEIHIKRLGFFFTRMPPLDVLDRINYQAVALGFLFLTIGIGSGVVWSLTARGATLLLDAKEVSALVVWLLYATHIHGYWMLGWRGQRTAVFSVINFALLFAIFFVTSFVLRAHQF